MMINMSGYNQTVLNKIEYVSIHRHVRLLDKYCNIHRWAKYIVFVI